MLNQIIFVGRVAELKPYFIDEEEKGIVITLRVSREENKADLVPVHTYQPISEKIKQYTKVGDIIGVKGVVRSENIQDFKLVAQKVTFLSRKEIEEEEDELE